MSSSDDSIDNGATGGSTSMATSFILGYCHQCDRQVPLNPELYTCNVCSSGFVEILDETPIQPAAAAAAEEVPSRGRRRNETEFLFNSNQGPTRIQLFGLPGEQFDLYGIMNSVLNDLVNGPARVTPTQHTRQVPLRMFQLHGNLGDYAFGSGGLDAIITQLLSQLENTGPPPASDNQVHNLPVLVISEKQVEENVQCPICMEDFNLNEKAKKLPCNHFFHESCISQWLKLHGTCPVCRLTLSGEDTSQREYIRPPDAPTGAASSVGTNQASSGQEQNATNRRQERNNRQEDVYDPMDFD